MKGGRGNPTKATGFLGFFAREVLSAGFDVTAGLDAMHHYVYNY